MSKYRYEDLSPKQFEQLTVIICKRLLGYGVVPFADGTDGGRDARFEGRGTLIPSKTEPWNGKVIIQAKHTLGTNKSYSDSEFLVTKTKKGILGEEAPKISKLKNEGQLDYYLLFSNRRLTAEADRRIREYINKESGVPIKNILVWGLEALEMHLREFEEDANLSDLEAVDSPLIVSPDELAEIVEAFAAQKEAIDQSANFAPVERVSFEEKNRVNNLTASYEKMILKNYLAEFQTIQKFLADPQNAELLSSYEASTVDFHAKISSQRQSFNTYNDLLERLIEVLFERDAVLRMKNHRRITRALVYYMYWNCDIGEKPDASTK